MKNHLIRLFPWALAACCAASAQTYTNYIRQWQTPSRVQWDASSDVAALGTQDSALTINPGGARFDLFTLRSFESSLEEFRLDSRYVNSYEAEVTIISKDPHEAVLRTRADLPFQVMVTVSGLLSGATDPASAKSVTFRRHVQSYGAKGTGEGIDPGQAILLEQYPINKDVEDLPIANIFPSQIPGADRAKIRGEERFSFFTVTDAKEPNQLQVSSKTIQIWPVSDGKIGGIAEGQVIKGKLPDLTVTMNDLYPDSTTLIQFYSGPKLDVSDPRRQDPEFCGQLQWSEIPNKSVPTDAVKIVTDYDNEKLKADGIWTFELVTVTRFDMTRLHAVTFELDRTIKMNGSFTTME